MGAISTTTNIVLVERVATGSVVSSGYDNPTVVVSSENSTLVNQGNMASVIRSNTDIIHVITAIAGPKGAAGINEEDMAYSKRIDFITDNELYKGEALVGSLESAPVWRIRKITIAIDSDIAEVWASGTSDFDKVWSDRLTYVYS